MTKEADRWSDFSLGGSSGFIFHRKLSLINAFTVEKIFRNQKGHLLIMVKLSTFDRLLPLYDFIANTGWLFEILVWGGFVLFYQRLSPLNSMIFFLHLKAHCHSPGTNFGIEVSCSLSSDDISSLPKITENSRSLRQPLAPWGKFSVLWVFQETFSVSKGSASPSHILRRRSIFYCVY